MLTELEIRNFAIIEHQVVPFTPGLNVISGETGAGKSIILQALELILGGRPRPHSVREGSDALEVRALFSLEQLGTDARDSLPEEVAGKDDLLLVRTITAGGKGKVYVNGRLGTVSLLEAIASQLISICGQTQHVRLLEPEYHVYLLDDFAGNSRERKAYSEVFELWRRQSKALAAIEERTQAGERRRAELEAVISELTPIAPVAGLREQLENAVKRLGNGEKLLTASQRIVDQLNSDSGLLNELQAVAGELRELRKLGAPAEVLDLFDSARVELQEFASGFEEFSAAIELDDKALEAARERLAELARVERKYRLNDVGLAELLRQSREELSLFDGSLDVSALRREVEDLFRRVIDNGSALRRSRTEAGKKLAMSVRQELKELNMKDASLELAVLPTEPSASGTERIEFLLVSNKGESARPLRQIASGGELSRITLVLKKLLKDRAGIAVLVFDEVDSGISGGVARAVGSKLKDLASDSQVICITHLPQVASLADTHLRVEKLVGERTVSVARVLTEDERVDEVARMLAGFEVTDTARSSARELINSGR